MPEIEQSVKHNTQEEEYVQILCAGHYMGLKLAIVKLSGCLYQPLILLAISISLQLRQPTWHLVACQPASHLKKNDVWSGKPRGLPQSWGGQERPPAPTSILLPGPLRLPQRQKSLRARELTGPEPICRGTLPGLLPTGLVPPHGRLRERGPGPPSRTPQGGGPSPSQGRLRGRPQALKAPLSPARPGSIPTLPGSARVRSGCCRRNTRSSSGTSAMAAPSASPGPAIERRRHTGERLNFRCRPRRGAAGTIERGG